MTRRTLFKMFAGLLAFRAIPKPPQPMVTQIVLKALDDTPEEATYILAQDCPGVHIYIAGGDGGSGYCGIHGPTCEAYKGIERERLERWANL